MSSKPECSGLGERTINLAKQGNTLEDRKIKLLVCDKEVPTPRKPCGASLPIGVTSTPKSAKRIRVCSGAELKQRTCPPQMCDCPPRVRLTPKGVVLQTFKFGTKCLIAGGLVYWTWHIGLWGDADKTEKIFVDIRNLIKGEDCQSKNYGMGDCNPPQTIGPILAKSKGYWNCFIGSACRGMSNAIKTVEGMITGKEMCPECREECEKPPPPNPRKRH